MNSLVNFGRTESSTYDSAFVVKRENISRILEIIEGKFKLLDMDFSPQYTVRYKEGQTSVLRTSDELFSLDNTVRNPIVGLIISSFNDSDSEAFLSCKVCFGYEHDPNTSRLVCSELGKICLKVESSDSTVSRQTFASLEEQVQRTYLSSILYKTLKALYKLWTNPKTFISVGNILFFTIAAPILLVFLIFSGFVVVRSFLNLASGENLSTFFSEAFLPERIEPSLVSLMKTADESGNIQDKVDFLFELSKNNIQEKMNRYEDAKSIFDFSIDFTNYTDILAIPFSSLTFRLLLIGIVVVAAIALSLYTIASCYPTKVFLVGDYEHHYQKILSRRNAIWNFLFLTFFSGILINIVTPLFQL
ncbi:MAG: hypothetical protein AAFY78_01010 [Cyanobacteria bacterium J06648_16]